MMDDTVVLPTSSLAPDDDPLPVISEDVPAQSSLKGSSLRDDANGTERSDANAIFLTLFLHQSSVRVY